MRHGAANRGDGGDNEEREAESVQRANPRIVVTAGAAVNSCNKL